MPDITQFSRIQLSETDAALDAHLDDVSSPHCVWDGRQFRSREDQISYRRWRRGFLVFYGAAALLLGGLVVTADRLTMVASTAAPVHSAAVNQ